MTPRGTSAGRDVARRRTITAPASWRHPGGRPAPPRRQGQDEPLQGHFRSIDSAPSGISVDRPASAANGFLITFTALALLTMAAMAIFVHEGTPEVRAAVILSQGRGNVAMPTRLFVVCFFVAYALYAYGNRWRRLAIGASLVGKFAAVVVAFDVLAWALHRAEILEISTFGQQLASVIVALAIFPHTILRQARLPEPAPPPSDPRTPPSAFVIFFVTLAVSFGLAAVLEIALEETILTLREWAIIGGLGPGVFLAQQIFAALSALTGWRAVGRSRRGVFAPPIAILVPAHNEAHDIAATIVAVDAAAATYPGTVRMYVVDNASRDATTHVAERALSQCVRITGQVLQCPEPGKAIALNLGIAHITEDFVVRIDADTAIGPGCLRTAMRHFADPRVGSVGGLPLPKESETWIDKVRLVEVYLRHGFFQVARNSYQGVVGVPGMFAVYRRDAVVAVGGMVQGMNGEDTDICLRLDGAGYRTVADPKAVYYSETPATYAHLREQRVRWFRSLYHIAAHNRAALSDRRSLAGGIVLPFQMLNAARRAMLTPILVFALLTFLFFRGTFPGMPWQPLVETLIGMPMIVSVIVCLVWQPSAVRFVPLHMGFRVLRSYFTLAAVLSLAYPPLDAPWTEAARRWRGVRAGRGGPAGRGEPAGADPSTA